MQRLEVHRRGSSRCMTGGTLAARRVSLEHAQSRQRYAVREGKPAA